ncbi:lipase maturation factor family protein [Saxibacter everestensis]|uniref:Lipase maturation factor family protein n=1 Tax=Saxibacter everestensis TaxID=2909229 RepID=A0ABY8R0H9_9MICO|nr:lipase maturation factor family protein [Brevibacteriaceae bacterium ZFBP1038]
MDWLNATDYDFAREVLQRGVAALYVIGFASAIAQFPALLGEHGLLPAPAYLSRIRGRRIPTIFHWRYSDRLLIAVCVFGIVVSLALVLGLPQAAGPWLPFLAFGLIWLGYLSIVNIGQTFYGFGWESLLLEAGFLMAFLGSHQAAPPILIIFLARWLAFRLEFGAGMIKIRGDRSWRDLTALYYHHETQPMPNPVSRTAHRLPKPLHRVEVLGNHFTQLVVPFFLFAPQPLASAAAGIIIVTQLWLVISGNFAWLNVLTIILAFSAVSDPVAGVLLPWLVPGEVDTIMPGYFVALVLGGTLLMLVLSYWPARNLVSRHQLMNASFNSFHLVNAYGAFGTVTQQRYEVIVEGTRSESPDATDWQEYEFKGKPGDLHRMPRQFAPYHLRLDWLMWFLALGGRTDRWFIVFLQRLLEADRRTLRLLRLDPFRGERPRWVRARLFLYRFSDRAEKREQGVWWVRHELTTLIPPIGLPDQAD